MKKITLLVSCCILSASAFSQVTSYATSTDFHNAFTGNLILESFENGPTDPAICGMTISSEGDGCFNAGQVVPGFTLFASNHSDVIFLPAGFLPSDNITPRLGANAGVEYTIINFPENSNVHAVGHSLYIDGGADFSYKVYNQEGVLIFDKVVPFATYFSVVSTEAISVIEIANVDDAGELLGDLEFEATPLSVDENQNIALTVSPVPASDNITITTNNQVEKISIYNMLGQTLIKQNANSGNSAVSIATLQAGHYVVKVTFADGNVASKRFIKM